MLYSRLLIVLLLPLSGCSGSALRRCSNCRSIFDLAGGLLLTLENLKDLLVVVRATLHKKRSCTSYTTALCAGAHKLNTAIT